MLVQVEFEYMVHPVEIDAQLEYFVKGYDPVAHALNPPLNVTFSTAYE